MATTTTTKRPAIPAVPVSVDETTRQFLTAVKESVEIDSGFKGSELAMGVTKEYLASQVFLDSLGTTSTTVEGTAIISDDEAPDPPTNFVVVAGAWSNHLSWTNPTDSDLFQIEIWENTENDTSTATRIAIVPVPITEYRHPIECVTVDHYYWVRAIDSSLNYSIWCPPPAQGGYLVYGATSLDDRIAEILADLAGEVDETLFTTDFNSRLDTSDSVVSQLQTDLGITDDALVIAQSDIGAAETAIGTAQTDLSAIEGRVTTTETSITTNTDNIALKASKLDLNATDGKVATAEAAIILNANDIALKAAQTEVDTLTGTVSDAEAAIIVNAGDITLKAAQTEVDTLSGTVGTHSTSIQANADAILLKADQTEVDTISGTVDTHGTSIQANSDAIVLKAAKTTVNTLIDRVDTAESTITQNASDIALKASQTQATQISDDLNTAEIDIAAAELSIGTHETELGALQSEFAVKLDVNGYVSGFGIVGQQDYSEAVFFVDKFKIIDSSITVPKTMFTVGTVDDVTTVGINGNEIVDGTILSRSIQTGSLLVGDFNTEATDRMFTSSTKDFSDLGGTTKPADNATKNTGALADKDAVDLNSTEVTNKSLAVLDSTANTKLTGIDAGATDNSNWESSYDSTEIDGGKLNQKSLITVAEGGAITVGSDNLILDSDTNTFYVCEDGGITANDYALMTAGKLLFKYWTGTEHVTYNSVQRIEVGVADNDTTVEIPGYFKTTPKIIVSPATLQCYSEAYPENDQKLECTATSLQLITSETMRYQFDVLANLQILTSNTEGDVADKDGTAASDFYSDTVALTSSNLKRLTVACSNTAVYRVGTLGNPDGDVDGSCSIRKINRDIELWISTDGGTVYTEVDSVNINNTGDETEVQLDSGTQTSDITHFKIKYNYLSYAYDHTYSKYLSSENDADLIDITYIQYYGAQTLLAEGTLNWMAIGE